MKLFEKTINEDYKFKGAIINLKVLQVELPNGKVGKREIVEHPGAVGIVAYLNSDTILIVEQFRKALDRTILEIPAGKIEKGEDIKLCGIRELEEETGYRAKKFQLLGKIATAPGFSDEYIYLYKATELYKGEVNRDDDEFINVKSYSIDKIKEMVKSGEVIDGKTIAALAYL